MIEAGINDGDYVVVKRRDIVPSSTTAPPSSASSRIDQSPAPENSTMDPIITTDCSIAGKVVAVFRRL